MPVVPPLSYPGVYIQEVKSDIHTIVPVSTATAAFIGRALRGPVNEPKVINSFADFERIYGGLWTDSCLGYAVDQFFSNDGSQAVIVRLYNPPQTQELTDEEKKQGKVQTPNKEGKAVIAHNGLPLIAKSPGEWGNQLAVRITGYDESIKEQIANKYHVTENIVDKELFNLTVHDKRTGAIEYFTDLTTGTQPGLRRVAEVLESDSSLIRVDPQGKLAKRPDLHPDQNGTGSVWDNNVTCTMAVNNSGSNGKHLSFKKEGDRDADIPGSEKDKTGIYALEKTDIFNLLYIPPDQLGENILPAVLQKAAEYCEKKRAFLLVDPPLGWNGKDGAKNGYPINGFAPSKNAAIYFPNIMVPDRLRENRDVAFGPGGVIAGIYARTDAARGVWKAPAGLEATLKGVTGLKVQLTDAENGELNPLGINCLRQMPAAGYVVWGARTTVGDDRLANEWKYIPVRRTALYIEESLYRGTQWAVFEPNDEPLWSQLRLNIGAFMHGLFRQGAFQGQSPKDAYFVKCDSTTTTQADIDRGIVNVWVGFAPLKPAEFIILYISQKAGQVAV